MPIELPEFESKSGEELEAMWEHLRELGTISEWLPDADTIEERHRELLTEILNEVAPFIEVSYTEAQSALHTLIGVTKLYDQLTLEASVQTKQKLEESIQGHTAHFEAAKDATKNILVMLATTAFNIGKQAGREEAETNNQ